MPSQAPTRCRHAPWDAGDFDRDHAVPQRAVYGPGDVVRVRVRAADRDGNQINAVDAEISVSPGSFAEMTGPTNSRSRLKAWGRFAPV